MATQNSQKKSPRSSAKSKQDTTEILNGSSSHQRFSEEDDKHFDRSFDHVARVRAAKEAAQRKMESFGDISEYDITIIQGQLREDPNTASQSSLNLQSDCPAERQETD